MGPPRDRHAEAAFGDWDVPNGRVVWSAPVERILGEPVPDGSVPLDWWRGRMHPDDRRQATETSDTALSGSADRYACSYRVRRSDGRWVWVTERAFVVRDGGRAVRVVAALSTRDAAASPIESAPAPFRWNGHDATFRAFVDAMPSLAWAMTPAGWISFYNRRWHDYTGATPQQMEGWGWLSAHDPHDLPRVLRLARIALTRGAVWEDEFRLRRATARCAGISRARRPCATPRAA